MRPRSVGWIVGIVTFVVSVGIMLAGSDHPPPQGFILVIVACAGLGALMVGLVALVARRRSQGRSVSALALVAASGAAYLMIVAGVLVLANPGTAGIEAVPVFVAVAGGVGAVGGLACGALIHVLLGVGRRAK